MRPREGASGYRPESRLGWGGSMRRIASASMLYVTAALVGLVVGPSVPAWADVTYVYTGNTYRNSGSPNFAGGFSPPYTAADYVTATLTLKNEIGANQTAFFVPFSDIVVFTMSDGVQTLDVFSPQLYAEGANFATDSF